MIENTENGHFKSIGTFNKQQVVVSFKLSLSELLILQLADRNKEKGKKKNAGERSSLLDTLLLKGLCTPDGKALPGPTFPWLMAGLRSPT